MREIETYPLAELLLRGAARHPHLDCIALETERATYGELEARARRAARSLISLGVEPGDRVGILMANCLDFVDILFGASMIGAVAVLYNARFKAREIAHVTADSGVKVIVTNDIVEQHTNYVELLQRGLQAALGRAATAGSIDLASVDRRSRLLVTSVIGINLISRHATSNDENTAMVDAAIAEVRSWAVA